MTDSLMRPPGGQIEIVPANEHFSRIAAGWIYLGPAPVEESKPPVQKPHKPTKAKQER